MATKPVSDIVAKQIRNVQAATEDIRAGVEAVTEAPGKKAAAAANKMRAGILKALDDGKWQDNVASVSLEDWKAAFLEKGIGRIPEGIAASEGKLINFHTQLQAYQSKYLPAVRSKPSLTLEDNIQKAAENIRQMAKFRFKR